MPINKQNNLQKLFETLDKYVEITNKRIFYEYIMIDWENDDLAYALKSRIEFQMGMLDASRIDNDKAIELNDCPEYQFDRAKILFKSGQYKQAKDLFTQILPNIQTSKIYE